jgi:hypothetical protein
MTTMAYEGEGGGAVEARPTPKSALSRGARFPLYLREKCRLDCIFFPMAFDLWLDWILYFGVSWKIQLFSCKILICPEQFCDFREKIC